VLLLELITLLPLEQVELEVVLLQLGELVDLTQYFLALHQQEAVVVVVVVEQKQE
jgi:hypothetical protein